MKEPLKTLKVLLVFFVGALLTACQPASVDRSKIKIRIPTAAELQASGKVTSLAAIDYSLLCFAVNVTGGPIPSQNLSCDASKGVITGSVPQGGTLELDVPYGEGMTFEVFGLLRTSTSVACPTVAANSWNWPLKKVYSLGKTADVKVSLPDQSVEVVVSMPDAADHLFAALALPATCEPTQSAPPTMGRVASGTGLLTGTTYKMYGRITSKNEIQEIQGSQFRIRQWTTGDSQ